MMNMGWDPEVPTGYQDADIEMAELASDQPSVADFEDYGTCVVCDDPFLDEEDRTWAYAAGATEEVTVHADCMGEGLVYV